MENWSLVERAIDGDGEGCFGCNGVINDDHFREGDIDRLSTGIDIVTPVSSGAVEVHSGGVHHREGEGLEVVVGGVVEGSTALWVIGDEDLLCALDGASIELEG